MQFTAEIIAKHLGGELEGRRDVLVGDFSKIDQSRPGTITFLSNPQYAQYIYTTTAAVVLVRRDFVAEGPIAATLIRVDDPYIALSQLLALVAQYLKPQPIGIEQPCRISDSAVIGSDCYIGAFSYIGDGAVIGNNVSIYPQAYIGPGVEIGDNTTIYSGAKIYYGCKIGRQCTIHSGAVIGADGFGFAPGGNGIYHKIEQIGRVVIGDDVEIGANTTVDRSTIGTTTIEHGVKLDNLIQIGHNCHIGHDTVMAAQAGVAGSTTIGSNCTLAGQVGVSGHSTIGPNTVIGPQSGVPKSVPKNSKIMGTPAIPWGEFARITASLKHLPDLVRTVDMLKKEHEKNNKTNN